MSTNVYPDPDPPGGRTAPSSVPLDAASLISGTISVGAAAAGVASGGEPVFLFPPSMAANISWTSPLLVHPISIGWATIVIIFGALSVILGTLNLFWGLSRKKKLAEQMRNHQRDLDEICTRAGISS